MALSGAKIDRDQAWLYADVQFAPDFMNDAGQKQKLHMLWKRGVFGAHVCQRVPNSRIYNDLG